MVWILGLLLAFIFSMPVGCSNTKPRLPISASVESLAFAKFLGSITTFYACSAHMIYLTDYLVPVPGNCNRHLRTN